MLILDGTGINLRKFPRIKALDDDLWVALGDVVSENAVLRTLCWAAFVHHGIISWSSFGSKR
jgi:hypothetical protein